MLGVSFACPYSIGLAEILPVRCVLVRFLYVVRLERFKTMFFAVTTQMTKRRCAECQSNAGKPTAFLIELVLSVEGISRTSRQQC